MTVFERTKAAVAFTGYECYAISYTGANPIYFVFNVFTTPVDFADDFPQHLQNLCQLHLYAPITLNTASLRKQICLSIADADFTFPIIEDASDSDSQHLVFEFSEVECV